MCSSDLLPVRIFFLSSYVWQLWGCLNLSLNNHWLAFINDFFQERLEVGELWRPLAVRPEWFTLVRTGASGALLPSGSRAVPGQRTASEQRWEDGAQQASCVTCWLWKVTKVRSLSVTDRDSHDSHSSCCCSQMLRYLLMIMDKYCCWMDFGLDSHL